MFNEIRQNTFEFICKANFIKMHQKFDDLKKLNFDLMRKVATHDIEIQIANLCSEH